MIEISVRLIPEYHTTWEVPQGTPPQKYNRIAFNRSLSPRAKTADKACTNSGINIYEKSEYSYGEH